MGFIFQTILNIFLLVSGLLTKILRLFLSRNLWKTNNSLVIQGRTFNLTVNQAEILVDALLRQTRILVGVLLKQMLPVFSQRWVEWNLMCTEYDSYLIRRLRPLTLMHLCRDKQPGRVVEEHSRENQEQICLCFSQSPLISHFTCACFIPLSEMQLIATPTSWCGSEEQMKLSMLRIL